MPHKYAALLAVHGITNCPCATAQPYAALAYRFVELPAAIPANFIPRGQMGAPPPQPRKINIPQSSRAPRAMQSRQQMLSSSKLCNFWGGLSLFSSEGQARQFFRAQLLSNRHFTQTHIAELSLMHQDGWADVPDKNGHFAFHEADTAVIFTAAGTANTI